MSIAFEYIAGNYFSKFEKRLLKIPGLSICAAYAFFYLRKDFRARCLFLFQSKRMLRETILCGELKRTGNKNLQYPQHVKRTIEILTSKRFSRLEDTEKNIVGMLSDSKSHDYYFSALNQILYLDILIFSESIIIPSLNEYRFEKRVFDLPKFNPSIYRDPIRIHHLLEILSYADDLCESYESNIQVYIIFKIRTLLELMLIDTDTLHFHLKIILRSLEVTRDKTINPEKPVEFSRLFMKEKISRSERMMLRIVNNSDQKYSGV